MKPLHSSTADLLPDFPKHSVQSRAFPESPHKPMTTLSYPALHRTSLPHPTTPSFEKLVVISSSSKRGDEVGSVSWHHIWAICKDKHTTVLCQISCWFHSGSPSFTFVLPESSSMMAEHSDSNVLSIRLVFSISSDFSI